MGHKGHPSVGFLQENTSDNKNLKCVGIYYCTNFSRNKRHHQFFMKSYKTLFPKLSILIASFYTSLFLYFQTVSESKILFCKNEEQRIDYMIFS
jgi:hypothetical protein